LRGFKGFALVFEDLYLLSAYLPAFEEIGDEEPSGEKDRKRTAQRTPSLQEENCAVKSSAEGAS